MRIAAPEKRALFLRHLAEQFFENSEDCVIEENAHIGKSPEEFAGETRENWGIAVTGHNITVSAGKEVAPKQILSESV